MADATKAVPVASHAVRQRVPAAERRAALIDAAVEEFAHGGYHGTPVSDIARRVGVAQPYVFSLFPSKRDLFIAAVQRGFERVSAMFAEVAERFDPSTDETGHGLLMEIGDAYIEMMQTDRPVLMLQLQAYAACDDPVIRDHVRDAYARLVLEMQELSGQNPDELTEFFSIGMWLSVQGAMQVENLGELCQIVAARKRAAAEL